MEKEISQLTNVVGFNLFDLDHDMDLFMSDKEGLSNDLIGVGKVSREEGTVVVEVVCKLTCRRFSEALQIINKADPNTERNSKVQIHVLTPARLLFQITERKKDESFPEIIRFLP